MWVVDAHQDIAFNALCFNRDYRVSALRKRTLEAGQPTPNGIATSGLPEAIAGRVAVVFATIFTAPMSRKSSPWSALMYTDAEEAYRIGLRQLDYYNRIVDEDGRLRLIQTQADLDEVLATMDQPLIERKQGIVLLMENADPISEPKQFEEWYERGVRIVGPAWQATRYTAGTGAPGPLTSKGRALLDVMMSFNTVLDLSHMAEEAYFQALDQYEGSIIASHSNPRKFCNTDRHLSDDMIRQLAERDGVMGIAVYNAFLDGEWSSTDRKQGVKLTRIVDIIDHVCQLTGSARHIGIGTDFDGGFGAESIPYEIDTIADLWQLKDALPERGFNEDEIAAILGGNMTRKLREGLPD